MNFFMVRINIMNRELSRDVRRTVFGLGFSALLMWGPVIHAGDASWTNWLAGVTGAAWGDAGNWTNSAGVNALPDNGHAYFMASGASYTVNYDSAQPDIKDLVVENAASYRTDLIVSAPLTSLGGAMIRLKGGSSVTVTNGGLWTYEGTNAASDNAESMFSIREGGELHVAGGDIMFTNLVRASTSYGNYFNVGYESTGTLRVTSGRLHYYNRSTDTSVNPTHRLVVGRGKGGNGNLEVSGGSVALGVPAGGGSVLELGVGSGAPFGSTRGSVIVSGGELVITNHVGWNQMRIGFNYGIGTFVVTNTGYVNLRAGGVAARVYMGGSPYGEGTLRMNGGYMYVGDGLTVGYANGYSASVSSTGRVEVTAGTLNTGAGLHVASGNNGSASCVGTCSITGGRLMETYWGVFVGRARNGSKATGYLEITNGVLDIVGAPSVSDGNQAHAGLGIGVINHNDANATTVSWGEMMVSDSAVVNNAGVLVIGVNGATGTLMQTGGMIRHLPQGGDTKRFTIIGYGTGASTYFGGGSGMYEIAGGSYDTPNRVFIGGVPTDIQSFSNAGGVGTLKVSGGTFTTDDTLMVGGYGTGTLTIGSSGTCDVQNLILTNTTSTLLCEFGVGGLGALNVSDTLTINTGAKLEVDTTAYQGSTVWVKLVNCATRTTAFAPENITVMGDGVVRQDKDEDIWLYMQHGTIIFFR